MDTFASFSPFFHHVCPCKSKTRISRGPGYGRPRCTFLCSFSWCYVVQLNVASFLKRAVFMLKMHLFGPPKGHVALFLGNSAKTSHPNVADVAYSWSAQHFTSIESTSQDFAPLQPILAVFILFPGTVSTTCTSRSGRPHARKKHNFVKNDRIFSIQKMFQL